MIAFLPVSFFLCSSFSIHWNARIFIVHGRSRACYSPVRFSLSCAHDVSLSFKNFIVCVFLFLLLKLSSLLRSLVFFFLLSFFFDSIFYLSVACDEGPDDLGPDKICFSLWSSVLFLFCFVCVLLLRRACVSTVSVSFCYFNFLFFFKVESLIFVLAGSFCLAFFVSSMVSVCTWFFWSFQLFGFTFHILVFGSLLLFWISLLLSLDLWIFVIFCGSFVTPCGSFVFVTILSTCVL